MVLGKDEMWEQRRALTLVRNRFVLSVTPCRFLTFLDAKIASAYTGGGRDSYHPKMLTKVIVYAYTQRI
ncbi:hypothetical protein J14TS5_08690 [Paenibacillus lautus]|nr:hypothetical protein J14TS5_08690 [Paenibacillus lautus]